VLKKQTKHPPELGVENSDSASPCCPIGKAGHIWNILEQHVKVLEENNWSRGVSVMLGGNG
jgi:hypothetical protein